MKKYDEWNSVKKRIDSRLAPSKDRDDPEGIFKWIIT
jgi:hypothetical protein